MGYIIVTLIIILIISIISFLYWDDEYQKSDFEDRMRNSDIYLELIEKIDATEFEEEEMIEYIKVYRRYIEVQYFNPKPKGYGHYYKVEIDDDKLDMSISHRKVLLKVVSDYCIENIDIYNNLEQVDEFYDDITMYIKYSNKEKYINSYKTPIC